MLHDRRKGDMAMADEAFVARGTLMYLRWRCVSHSLLKHTQKVPPAVPSRRLVDGPFRPMLMSSRSAVPLVLHRQLYIACYLFGSWIHDS
nr:hypothetical protein CFP56_70762 [Quercus suber]